MNPKTRDRIFLIISWLVAALFIFAGISKIINPKLFVQNIDNYRLLPYLLVTLAAIILPWLEVLCGIFLILGKWRKGAAVTLLALSFIFLIAIGSAVARNLDITCGCFSDTVAGTKAGFVRLVEDIVLFGVILMINIKINKDRL